MKRSKIVFLFVSCLFVIFAVGLYLMCIGDISKDRSATSSTNKKEDLMWGYEIIGQEARNNDTEPVKIAILDSGINKSHKEFNNITFYEFNAIAPSKSVKDEYGHGTAIAGIIAAGGEEIKGISQNATLYDVKVLDSSGKGKVKDVVRGINWCIEQKVDIINISFGFEKDHDELRNAINNALHNNIIITAASGNTLGLTVEYPAKYRGVLSISSFDEKLKIDPVSAKGKIDFSAPGVNIKSIDKDGSYIKVGGTSFATAFATGAIGCLISKKKISKENFHQTLKKYAVDLGSSGYDKEFGHGMIICNKGEK
ncbi:thermitase [Bacillus sp. BT1B_CT2]|uniref:S8 family peptidase n=1 Tax=Bacillus TaxID=1386 RepID=UPI0001F4444F|nr:MULTISPECIES: S8 family serine peptidase [Bacillus]EFV72303.1 thermitase [Bacillus sp. BT1B_CT2]MDQ9095470.1 S8 family serine peptidase [Bacillus licheniformis]MEC0476956.1 S8 family serine peptidase [Bacillus licheniformis]MEC0491079.1 S8 family serine peptidase [Bacillus licheniformis]MED4372547.1 S8 family serine peptidase [Bacillus licheniformis]